VDNTKAINTISFFTGYGGVERGLKLAGERVNHIASCEIEAYAEANLIHKMETGALPPHPIWTDAKTFPGSDFLGKVDLFTGGFPCQPFSAAGSRNADEDPRHLFPTCLKFIEEAQPNRVFLENVEGLISAKLGGDNWADPKGTPVLLHVLRELERRGYKATWGIFSAEEVGAPHRRKRVFILGHSTSKRPHRGSENCEGEQSEVLGERLESDELANCDSSRVSGGERRKEGEREKLGNPQHNGLPTTEERGSTAEASNYNKKGENSSCELEGASTPKGLRDIQGGEREKLAQSDSEGSHGQLWDSSKGQERRKEERRYSAQESIWPTRPGERQGPNEQPRVKPKLGRAVNGDSHRVDRLRLLGNGVVPQTAALAWLTLNERLEMGGGATQDGEELEIS
jgi:DNA (cytosine-5)-methyltransferase 1